MPFSIGSHGETPFFNIAQLTDEHEGEGPPNDEWKQDSRTLSTIQKVLTAERTNLSLVALTGDLVTGDHLFREVPKGKKTVPAYWADVAKAAHEFAGVPHVAIFGNHETMTAAYAKEGGMLLRGGRILRPELWRDGAALPGSISPT
eukprot:CAMPEP_0180508606 /NCGR_PEP_ID=MMETSP1036_2-20121128/49267_1 /TAXON_ID=632150 /ORGANISM="Azadinium spinosum, Strain 3D9" /LENGTH=145 /DNA_ID=CAMNT_0022518935 /DNA_START=167 /DNA_END=601 /DNA_ORIENTATION=-